MSDIDFEELDRAVAEMMRKNSKKRGDKPEDDLDSEEMAKIDDEMPAIVKSETAPPKDSEKPQIGSEKPQIKLKNRDIIRPDLSKPDSDEVESSPSDEDAYKAKINSFLENYRVRRQEEKSIQPKKNLVKSDEAELKPKESREPKPIKSEDSVKPSPEASSDQPDEISPKPVESDSQSDDQKVTVKVKKPKPVLRRPRGKFMDFVNKPVVPSGRLSSSTPHSVRRVERAKSMVSEQAVEPSPPQPMSEPKPKPQPEPESVASVESTPVDSESTPSYQASEPTPEAISSITSSLEELDQVVAQDDAESSALEAQAKQQTKENMSGVSDEDDSDAGAAQVFSPKIDLDQATVPDVGALEAAESESESEPESELESEPERPKSPFIEQAKVKKRPLGTPEVATSAPSVTMEVPERLTRLRADEPQTALYRSELRPIESQKKTSNWGWFVVLFILISLLIFTVLYFFDDLKTLFV